MRRLFFQIFFRNYFFHASLSPVLCYGVFSPLMPKCTYLHCHPKPIAPILQECTSVLSDALSSTRPDRAPASLLLSTPSKSSRSIQILFSKVVAPPASFPSWNTPQVEHSIPSQSLKRSQLGVILPPRGHLAMSRDIFDYLVVTTQGSGLLLALTR